MTAMLPSTMPETIPFLACPNRHATDIGNYHVIDKATGLPIGDSIIWADADLGVYARCVKDGPQSYARNEAGTGAKKELVHADFEIRLMASDRDRDQDRDLAS